jgi:hypothetical protein
MNKDTKITSQGEARQFAVDWQFWNSKQSLSIGELIEWQDFFQKLADEFDLVEEFTENGLI